MPAESIGVEAVRMREVKDPGGAAGPSPAASRAVTTKVYGVSALNRPGHRVPVGACAEGDRGQLMRGAASSPKLRSICIDTDQ